MDNYNDLIGAVLDWSAREFSNIRLQDFVQLAEGRLQTELDDMDSEVTETLIVASGVLPVPTDLKTLRTLNGSYPNGPYTLAYRTPAQFADEAAPGGTYASIYTIEGNTIRLSPEQDDGAEFEAVYLARFLPLTTVNDVNWIMTNFPDAYFTGTMAEAMSYDRNEVSEAKWLSRFAENAKRIRRYIANQRVGDTPVVRNG